MNHYCRGTQVHLRISVYEYVWRKGKYENIEVNYVRSRNTEEESGIIASGNEP